MTYWLIISVFCVGFLAGSMLTFIAFIGTMGYRIVKELFWPSVGGSGSE